VPLTTPFALHIKIGLMIVNGQEL